MPRRRARWCCFRGGEGKNSNVLAHRVLRVLHPAAPPIPLLHVASTVEFLEVVAFRDDFARTHGFRLIVHANEEGRRQGLNSFQHGDSDTAVMRTEALKAALTAGGHDIIFGGARRDEEASRAKQRIASVRNAGHGWDPRSQRPDLWHTFNGRLSAGQGIGSYPLSTWTEENLWTDFATGKTARAPLYFAQPWLGVVRGWERMV